MAINLVAGGDGIMSKTQNAVIRNNIEEAKERVTLKIAEYQTDYYEAVYVDKEVPVTKKLGTWIAENHKNEIEVGDYKFEISGTTAPYDIKIKKNNKLKNDIVGKLSEEGKVTWPKTTAGGGTGDSGDAGEDEPDVPEVTPDTTAPSTPTSLELTATENSITAVASGSTDDVDSEVTYEYSIDNSAWQTSGEFTGLAVNTTYTVYARAKDAAGNESEAKQESVTLKYDIVEGSNKTINGATATTTNPIIPVGFRAVETTDATWADSDSDGNPDGWNNGLVIEDEDENQFVWVPVDGTTIEYAKNFSYPNNHSASSSNTSDDTDALPIDASGNAISESSQITNYGGFYVGRYEAGVPANQSEIDGTFGDGTKSKSDEDGTPVVQRNATVWTNISYNKSIPNAKKLYENSTSVRSGLVTGRQWDTLCSWIDSEKDINGDSVHSVTDSKNWGNYKNDPVDGDNGKQIAGSKEEWKAKNLYDLAGNTYEWTGEKRIDSGYSDSRINRGGYYEHDGSERPASYRCYYRDPSVTNDLISFRLVLYVM